MFRERLYRWLDSPHLFRWLIGLNLLMTLAVAIGTFPLLGGDDFTYLGLADGLAHGRYSYWYFYPDYIPDTFRNPGYPLFLFALRQLGLNQIGYRVVQVGLYVVTIGLVLNLARRAERPGSWAVRNLFLLILLPNIQLAYLAALIFPEMLFAFLIALYASVALLWPPRLWWRTLALGLIAGAIFQVRPMFVLFPLVQATFDLWRCRDVRPRLAGWAHATVMLALFGATMLPYGLWNARHNGVFSVTSLEGGGGLVTQGFWIYRMPGYTESGYWGNHMSNELIQFAAPVDVPRHIAAYEREWDVIRANCRSELTDRDRFYLPRMRREHPELFVTYSGGYTACRERELKRTGFADIRREPGYYAVTRVYSAVRLYVSGVQRDIWAAATTPLAKLKAVYPALSSGLVFTLAVFSILLAIHRRAVADRRLWVFAIALVCYFDVMHLPFPVQTRYTTPVRPWLYLATAMALAGLMTLRRPTDAENVKDLA